LLLNKHWKNDREGIKKGKQGRGREGGPKKVEREKK
jgi:hypothetical protein